MKQVYTLEQYRQNFSLFQINEKKKKRKKKRRRGHKHFSF